MYTQDILEESRNPANQGHLSHPDIVVEASNPSCGDQMMVELVFGTHPEGTQLTDIRWSGAGCAISQASMSVVSQAIKGMPITQILELTPAQVQDLLGLDAPVSYGRIKCLMLGVQAVKQAIVQYQTQINVKQQ